VAKTTGLAWTTLSVDNAASSVIDIRNDVTNFQFATPRGIQDTTGVDKSAYERLLLLADGTITLNGVFNAAVSHLVFRTVPSTSVLRTTSLAIASQTLAMEMLYTDYNLTRAQSGEFTWTAPGVLGDGATPTWA
jgi:hypothetical protein